MKTLVCKIKINIQTKFVFLKVDNLFAINNPSGKEFVNP